MIEDNKDVNVTVPLNTLREACDYLKLINDYKFWTVISRLPLTENFMLAYMENLNWPVVLSNTNVSCAFLDEHHEKINKYHADKYCTAVDKDTPSIWNLISSSQALHEPFMETHIDKLNKWVLVRKQKLSANFITRHYPEDEWLQNIKLQQELFKEKEE